MNLIKQTFEQWNDEIIKIRDILNANNANNKIKNMTDLIKMQSVLCVKICCMCILRL